LREAVGSESSLEDRFNDENDESEFKKFSPSASDANFFSLPLVKEELPIARQSQCFSCPVTSEPITPIDRLPFKFSVVAFPPWRGVQFSEAALNGVQCDASERPHVLRTPSISADTF
jgi:hypothetical protein